MNIPEIEKVLLTIADYYGKKELPQVTKEVYGKFIAKLDYRRVMDAIEQIILVKGSMSAMDIKEVYDSRGAKENKIKSLCRVCNGEGLIVIKRIAFSCRCDNADGFSEKYFPKFDYADFNKGSSGELEIIKDGIYEWRFVRGEFMCRSFVDKKNHSISEIATWYDPKAIDAIIQDLKTTGTSK